MPAKNRAARNVQDDIRNFRVKSGEFEFGGMIPDGDPGMLPENRPRLLVNTRLNAGAIVPRGGQTAAFDLNEATSGAPRGLFDFQMGTKRRLMVIGDGCPGLSSIIGSNLGSTDIEQSPKFQPMLYADGATNLMLAATYGDDLMLMIDAALRRFQVVDGAYGSVALGVSGSTQDETVYTLEAPYTRIKSGGEFPTSGLFFMAADHGNGASAIKSWDGLTIRDELTAIDPAYGFGLWRELLIVGFDGASTNRIKTRDASGAWTTYGPPATGACTFKQGVSYLDNFYWTTLGADLFKFDGTTITRLPIGTTGISAGGITHGIAVANGYLYVAWTTSGNVAKLLRYDGTTWVPAHKNFTTQFPTCIAARPLALFRGCLVCGVVEDSGGPGGRFGTLYTSDFANTSAAWIRTTPNAISSGDIDQLIPY